MEYVADLHLHSKYSRAVSKDMVLPLMALWAKKKGINILSTGDWTHPLWFREIKDQLVESEQGLFKLKPTINSQQSTISKDLQFLLSVEISSIYSQGGRGHRMHNLVFSPSFETAEKINNELVKRGCNLASDGRPIIGLSSIQLLELIKSIDENTLLIPCHAWTPWFSLYGSNSGFDSIDEAFGEYEKYIYGVETGLSSDPFMNWQIPELKNRSILSFSDAHSPMKMGREATVFIHKDGNPKSEIRNPKISYHDIISVIKKDKDAKFKIGYTIEFYPEEGKYHYNGHRNCQIVQTPQETKEKGAICPACHRPLTVGVMDRVQELARGNDWFGQETVKLNPNGVKWILDKTGNHPPFVKLVQLVQIIAESLSSTVSSLKVVNMYNDVCNKFGSELEVLLKTPIKEIQKEAGERVAEGVEKVRKGDIVILPGFDGQYGIVKIWDDKKITEKQTNLVNQLGLDF